MENILDLLPLVVQKEHDFEHDSEPKPLFFFTVLSICAQRLVVLAIVF